MSDTGPFPDFLTSDPEIDFNEFINFNGDEEPPQSLGLFDMGFSNDDYVNGLQKVNVDRDRRELPLAERGACSLDALLEKDMVLYKGEKYLPLVPDTIHAAPLENVSMHHRRYLYGI